jgi:copper homeostasis protein
MYTLEICANSYTSALNAQKGGANRVELCDNMAEGGTTPSYGQIKTCVQQLTIEVWPIIRPRGGDFLYSDEEFEVMKADILICKELNCAGAVTGILLANGDIDTIRCAQLIKIANPMPLAFHRAFDMSNNLKKSLEDIIELGFIRILTSGGKHSAIQGVDFIKELVLLADDRIQIMPGAGINSKNITDLQQQSKAKTFHSSARKVTDSKMQYKNQTANMGNIADEYQYELSDQLLIAEMVTVLNQ